MQQYNWELFWNNCCRVIGSLPEIDLESQFFLIVIVFFSQWVGAYSLANPEAPIVTTALVLDWVCWFRVGLELHSDQGWNFESTLFQDVCKLLGNAKTRTIPLHLSHTNDRVDESNHQPSSLNINEIGMNSFTYFSWHASLQCLSTLNTANPVSHLDEIWKFHAA